jgi:hypothetical protein
LSRGGHNKIEFDERDIEQIERMAGLGMPMKHMAAVLGCSKDTMERRVKDTPEIAAAIEKGRGNAAEIVYKTAFDMASGGRVPAMTMFWLKCQEGWREGHSASDEELRKAVAATTENVAKLYEIARAGNKSAA